MRLIDADKIESTEIYNGEWVRVAYMDDIDELPTIDAEPVRHGHWEVIDEAEPRRYGCSNCKRLSFTEDNYCSHCGAKMDEVEDEE